MGVDWLRNKVPNYRRSWSRNRIELANPDLFSKHPEVVRRSFLVEPISGTAWSVGNEFLLEVRDAGIDVLAGKTVIGRSSDVPFELLEILADAGNCGLGTVKQIHPLSGKISFEMIR